MHDDEAPLALDLGKHAVGARIRIAASPEEIWALVSNPHRHHEFDGSGSVQSQAIGPEELRRGDRFSVHMRRFGIPYRLPLRVTRSEHQRVLEWKQPTGHRWRWEIEPDGEDVIVTEAFDAAKQLPPVRVGLKAAGVFQDNAANIRASLIRMRGLFPSP